ncbi:hypothetical protein WG909_07685 [Peptostreptococcaceae bacterium AGR-M142]
MNYKYKHSKLKSLKEENVKGISVMVLIIIIIIILFMCIGSQIDADLTLRLMKNNKFTNLLFVIPAFIVYNKISLIPAIESANHKLKKKDINSALIKLKNDIESGIEKKFKNANSEKQKKRKNKYKFVQLEIKFRCYFELVKTQYTNEAKENLDKTFEEIIALLEIMNEKEEQAYLYYNKGISSEIIYNTNRLNEYKIEAQNNYQKSMELSKNQEFINQANKRLNNI